MYSPCLLIIYFSHLILVFKATFFTLKVVQCKLVSVQFTVLPDFIHQNFCKYCSGNKTASQYVNTKLTPNGLATNLHCIHMRSFFLSLMSCACHCGIHHEQTNSFASAGNIRRCFLRTFTKFRLESLYKLLTMFT